jgi:sugar transferase EpsL
MSKAIKRLLDVVVSLFLLLFLSLPMLLIALMVLLVDGSPILFRQQRPGYRGAPFTLIKFRTMRLTAAGDAATDSQRLTRLGRLLRGLSLDELPQLWNVLKGEMSLIGPRPLLMQYLERYTPEQARRHEVRPGITGWAQVNGRNALNWPERLAMDVWYVDNWSLGLDARIMARTVALVLRREGISQEGEATMSEFLGNENSVARG